MKRILTRPYESEASYCSESYITDKGTSISEEQRGDYYFQDSDWNIGDVTGFIDLDTREIILVTKDYSHEMRINLVTIMTNAQMKELQDKIQFARGADEYKILLEGIRLLQEEQDELERNT